MKKKTGYTGYVAVHDGFCYVNDRCRSMYNAAMSASNVVSKVLTAPNDPKLQKQLVDSLSDQEQASYNSAVDTCAACGDNCVMGSAFLGRGGY
ncbi:MAG: hypothetical protein WBD81_17295 [Collimonas pratensis]|uniref:hypothetical protein n=1 Tax=Collimonas pratensis TaxID=279113 RepID=UPI003C78CD59